MTRPVLTGAERSALRRLSEDSALRLHRWLVAKGWAGYDPYDLPGQPWHIRPASGRDRLLRAIAMMADRWFPLAGRRLFRIAPAVNAKGMALFAEGYRRLYQATDAPEFLARAAAALQWLEDNTATGYHGCCWGYPFDWQSRILIPRGTPSAVVSATAGEAFWGFYRMTGESRYLHTCDSICQFFLRDLRVDVQSGGICFSYTPLDQFHVHNANLKVAHLLAQVGRETDNHEYAQAAREAWGYTVGQQNDDGSICYWGREQSENCHIDHYHTGFELRSLHGIWKVTGEPQVRAALTAYYEFYLRNLFTPAGLPKMTPVHAYPIDIHGCAEAILCHGTLAPDMPRSWAALVPVVHWVVKCMQRRDGSFRYMIKKKGPVRWSLSIPYMRWGQAWMLRALAELQLLLARPGEPDTTRR